MGEIVFAKKFVLLFFSGTITVMSLGCTTVSQPVCQLAHFSMRAIIVKKEQHSFNNLVLHILKNKQVSSECRLYCHVDMDK